LNNKYIIPYFVVFSLLLFTCTNPTGGSGGDPESTYEQVKESTIGPEGGTISTDEFEMVIPPGALDISEQIELSMSARDKPLGSDRTGSPVFKIGPFSSEFDQPVEFKIKCQPSLTDGDTLMAVRAVIKGGDEETWSSGIFMFPAVLQDTFLVCRLEPPQSPAVEKSLHKAAASGYVFYYICWPLQYKSFMNEHFIVYYTNDFPESQAGVVGQCLEETLTRFYNMGYNFRYRTLWRLPVLIRRPTQYTWDSMYPEESVNGAYSSARGIFYRMPLITNYGLIEFNRLKIQDKNAESLKPLVAHEFFHAVQDCYDYQIHRSDNAWLDEATAVWTEGLFSSNPDYTSFTNGDNEKAPLLGAQAGASYTGKGHTNDSDAWNANRHGYGMSRMIRYLAGHYGNDIVRQMWEDIESDSPDDPYLPDPGNLIHLDHLLNQIPAGDRNTWWDDFLSHYIENNLYANKSVEWFTDGTPTLPTRGVENVKGSYPDLSGKLYLFNIPKGYHDESVRFRIPDKSAKLTVYKKVNNKSNENLSGDPAYEAVIPDLKNLGSNRDKLLVLVSNSRAVTPYMDKTNITLEYEVGTFEDEQPPPDFPYNHCEFHVWVQGEWNNSETGPHSFFFSRYVDAYGSLKNGRFDGKLDLEHGGDKVHNTLVVDMDLNAHRVTYFKVTGDWTEHSDYYGTDRTDVFIIESTDQPIQSGNNSYFGVLDEDVKKHIKDIDCEQTWIDPPTGRKVTDALADFDVDDHCELYIRFDEQEEPN